MKSNILLIIIFILFSTINSFSLEDPPLKDTGEQSRGLDSLLDINPKSLAIQDRLVYYNEIIANARHVNPHLGATYAELAVILHDSLSISEEHGRTYNLLGNIYFDQGYFSSAVKYYKKCLDIAIEIDSPGTIGYSYNDIGYAHRRTGDTEQALKNFQKAIEVLENTDEKEVIAHTYSNMSLSYLSLSEQDKALVAIRNAIKLYEELGMTREIIRCRAYEASVFSFSGEHEISIAKMKETLSDYEPKDLQDSFLLASIYRFMQSIMMDAGNYKESIEYGNIGKSIAAEINHHAEESRLYMTSHEVHLKFGDTTQAVQDLLYALDIAEKYGYGESILYIAEHLIALHDHITLEELLSYYKKHYSLMKQYNEEIFNNKLKNFDYEIEMARLEGENELLEAEKQAYSNLMFGIIGILILIVILISVILYYYKKRRILNNELKQINDDLESVLEKQRELNDTKDKFFSIIAHDLKNPFGSFKQSLQMLSDNYDEFTDSERQAFLYELNKSSVNLKKLLEDLLTWSQSQRGSIPFNPSNIHLPDVIKYTFESLETQARMKNIELSSRGVEGAKLYADFSMLSTILRNIVSNSIKYTNDGGRVSIYYDSVNGVDTISVKDNGIGMTDKVKSNLFKVGKMRSEPGTRNESGTGLGLILSYEFIEKHGGSIRVESEEGLGSTFVISLPKLDDSSLSTND